MASFPFSNIESRYVTRILKALNGVAQFQVLGLDSSGSAVPIDATNPANQPPFCITLSPFVDGTAGSFLLYGIISSSTFSFSPGKVFLSASGFPTQSITNIPLIAVLGTAVTSTSFLFNPNSYIVRLTV